MKSANSKWKMLPWKLLKQLYEDLREANRGHNEKVQTRQVVRGRLRQRFYAEFQSLDVKRSIRRDMARERAKREWRELRAVS